MSIGLFTYNYVVIKATYFRIGEVISGSPDKLTSEIKEKGIKRSLIRHRNVNFLGFPAAIIELYRDLWPFCICRKSARSSPQVWRGENCGAWDLCFISVF